MPLLRAVHLIPRERRWQWAALVPMALASALLMWAQESVVQRTGAAVAVRLFRASLSAPYDFHLRRNSARLIQTAGQSVDSTVGLVLGSGVNLATEGLTLLGLVGVLAWSAPMTTLFSLVVISVLLIAPLLSSPSS